MTCIEGHTEIVKLLLKYGADINVTDDDNVRDIILNYISSVIL